jgi:carbon storage regulator
MLVLSRKPGEVLNIGENITVTLLAVKGSRAVIGVSAPAEVSVLRAELVPNAPPASALPPAGIPSRGPALRHARRSASPVAHQAP